MAYEEAKYTVIMKEESFELRKYESHIVAETMVEGDFDRAGSDGFRRLFKYISGENQKKQSIAMTAPVSQETGSEKIAMTATVSQERAGPVAVLGATGSARIGRMVTDAVEQTLAGGLSEVRMTDEVLSATLDLRSFLFGAVYENAIATAEFSKAEGILGGLWERIRARPQEFLDPVILERDGLDAASRDFLAGMTDRFAVRLYERLFIPRPWIEVGGEPRPIQERL